MEETLIIDYKHVNIRRGERVILNDIDFEAHAGEFVFLTGVVGSGKTSLLKTIYGELPVEYGVATVLGRDMFTLSRRHHPALRRCIGIVFQDFKLLNDRSVARNLDFVLGATGWHSSKARSERIDEVLKLVGLDDKRDAMPYELSGGQQQLVCIARAVLNTPQLILADEATGNQDAESSLHTTAILHELARRGTTVIMATHNQALLQQFEGTIYLCEAGRLHRLDDGQDIPVATPLEEA